MSVVIATGFTGLSEPLDQPRIGWRAITGTVSASSAAAGFGAELAAKPQTYNAWRPSGGGVQTWEIDAGAPQDVSYCGIGAHTLGSDGASVAVEYWNGSAWVEVASHAPADDDAILFLFDEVTAQVWRVAVTVATDAPRLGNIRFGEVTELPRLSTFAPALPITEAEVFSYNVNRSDTGEWLGRSVVSNGLEFSVEVQHVSEAWAATEWRDFRRHCNEGGATFFIAPKPQSFPAEVAYAWPLETVRAERAMPNARMSRAVALLCGGYRKP